MGRYAVGVLGLPTESVTVTEKGAVGRADQDHAETMRLFRYVPAASHRDRCSWPDIRPLPASLSRRSTRLIVPRRPVRLPRMAHGLALVTMASSKISDPRCAPGSPRIGGGAAPLPHRALRLLVPGGCVWTMVRARDFSAGTGAQEGSSKRGDDGGVRRILLATGATAIAAVALAWVLRSIDPRSAGFAFLVVWIPMAWLGTMSRFVRPRLPERYHRLRAFERSGRLYELLGVKLAKRLLRRGPLAVFNPGLHLPAERTPESLRQLDQRMRDAEASHMILLVLMLGVAANAATRGWWGAAAWTLLFDVILNGYPVLLQRYNRALLRRRFDTSADRATRPPQPRS